ncbi:MAG TPA: 16S rRNA (cytosine(1402)-N(4))-methyltransferase RsmH [Limnochordia bacterium]|nr:16S rRNA (cytosine(1402)-N(4))-methyltransferase RsmH [Limnochordia bacterium]
MVEFEHEPVLLEAVLRHLAPKPGECMVDATAGGGGHARRIGERLAPHGRLIAFDQDPDALSAAAARLADLDLEITWLRSNFRELGARLDALDVRAVDGILFDVGVSSPQFDRPERGFSYRHDALLDMRMDPAAPRTAADLLATCDERELTRIIREYGEERWASRIARFIVEARARAPVERTGQLVELIKAAVPAPARRTGPHPARRTFQALRIAVNDELGALQAGLEAAVDRLAAGGRLVVIAFHSLEDRIVKHVLQEAATGCICPKGLPVCACGRKPKLRLLTKRPERAGEAETAQNPRARSALLRAAVRIEPSLPVEGTE